jgi:hypothetical protein
MQFDFMKTTLSTLTHFDSYRKTKVCEAMLARQLLSFVRNHGADLSSFDIVRLVSTCWAAADLTKRSAGLGFLP